MFLRVDAVRNPAELFQVRRPPSPDATKVWVAFTRRDFDALRRDTGVFTGAFAMVPDIATRAGGRAITGTLVTGNFFEVLGVNAALGRALTPADDERFAGRPVLVLSHRGWTRLFAEDRTAIGRSLLLNGVHFEIVGVMPPGFRGLATSPPDYWAPLELLGQFRQAFAGKENEVAVDVVGRLKHGVSATAATAALTAWASGNPDLRASNGRPKTILLNPSQGTAPGGVIDGLLRFAPLFFAFGLILMIGCANVANLLLARGVSRQREIGVRLSLGASRGRVVRQLLTESVLLALAAAVCGLAISRLLLEAAAHAAAVTNSPWLVEQIRIAASSDWRVVVFALSGAIAATAFFGLAPAVQATRLELVRTMRGELTRDTHPSRARQALIAVQVGASALLLICAAVFLRSAVAAATETPGLRTSDTVLLEMPNESTRAAMIQAVGADPTIAGVAASWPHGIGGTLATATGSSRVPVEYKFVSPEYFSLFEIDLLKGRGFTSAERSPGAGIVVVSDTIARRLWPDRDAIGQVVQLDVEQPGGARAPDATTSAPRLPFRSFSVVGVVREARVGRGPFEMIDAGVYLPIDAGSQGTSLILRVHGDPDQARQGLIERFTKVDPAMGGIVTVRTLAGRAAYVLQVAFWITAVLGSLALVLTVSGLFGVLSYVVAQRSQEIGIRMALGATMQDIAGLVLWQSARPIAAGLLAGGGLAATLATALMSTGAASLVRDTVQIFDPVAYLASLFCIGTACVLASSIPALRAARLDPMTTLRQE